MVFGGIESSSTGQTWVCQEGETAGDTERALKWLEEHGAEAGLE